jgi:NAD(P)-dependent dehydrogenase (short-subunit alcohol dehydrogenase family)
MEISGKTAIVSGAASGIGLGIATALAEAGANVVMADIQKDAVEEAAHGLSGTNKRVMPVRIDVTQEQSVLDALAEAERNFGKLHIACNNAGVPMHGTRMVDVPPGDWEFVIGVNIWGIIHGIRHFVPAILKHGEEGHIVNTASVAGFQNRRGTNQGPYSMSKYAVLSLSEALEHELEGTNVGVSVLCPGPVNTNIPRGAVTARTTWAGRKSGPLTKRYCPSAWPREVSIREGSANAWWTRSRPGRFMPLSAPSPPMSSRLGTVASRMP